MITEEELWKKIERDVVLFRHHIREKRYHQAKYIYETVRNVLCYMEVEESKKDTIFGVKNDRGEIRQDGMFRIREVDKVFLESCVKAKLNPQECILCRRNFRQKNEV